MTMALSMSGLVVGPCRSSVHSTEIVCSFLPKPMSSARMQPWPSAPGLSERQQS